MALRLVQANLKARDDVALGRFWSAALGWPTSGGGHGATAVAPAGFDWTDPDAAVCLDIIRVPDPATVRYRAHRELATTSAAHQAELVESLRTLGATPADGDSGTALLDPEGNLFRVREPQELDRDTGPIAAVVVDCADPRAMAEFWGEAVGWTVHEVSDDHARLRSARGARPYLEFRRPSATPAGGRRIHLDLVPYRGAGQAAEVDRLRSLGATLAGRGEFSWQVLADPEGSEFCVLAPA